jgi:hypothetical protein
MIIMSDNTAIGVIDITEASGNIGSENLTNPYVPILRSTAARITEPIVGA